jgi:hypothetical protein
MSRFVLSHISGGIMLTNKQKIVLVVWVVFSFSVLLSTFPITAALHEKISPVLLEWAVSERQLSPGQIDYWNSGTRDLSLLGLFAGLAISLSMRNTSWWLLLKYAMFLCAVVLIIGLLGFSVKMALALQAIFTTGIFAGLLYWPITTPVRYLLSKVNSTSPS